jgi:RNA polymerase sigma-70 factor (ECF subfamily)
LLLRLRDPADTASWCSFVDVYGPLVYGLCRRGGLRHEDAEDVTQEVFGRVAKAIRSFEYHPETGRFRSWLGTLVRNEVNRLFRKKGTDVLDQAIGAPDPVLDALAACLDEGAWASAFNAHVLDTALARSRPQFEEATWRAFELTWLESRPAVEAGRLLGRSLDFVYIAKSRVLKRLWEEVRELADDTVLGAISPP